MRSRWHHLKEPVLALRSNGASISYIEKLYGIPRSTLSGWFKAIVLTDLQRQQLAKGRSDGWAKARKRAKLAHNQKKANRIQAAHNLAVQAVESIDITNPSILDLALAMLYWGEGAKQNRTAIGSSDPKVLRFTLFVLRKNYQVSDEMIRCDLHLRMDQPKNQLIDYWSSALGLSKERFKYVAYDKRTRNRPTYNNYKGVCLMYCADIAIQRKLISLYNLFCDKLSEPGAGA